jgi:hypothetical protein
MGPLKKSLECQAAVRSTIKPLKLGINSNNVDAFAKILTMAKQKFRPTRFGGFPGAKAYI